MNKRTTIILLLIFTNVIAYAQSAALSLPVIFSDNMVLQQGIHTPVWGRGTPGQTVAIIVGSSKGSAKTQADGKWMVRMPVMRAGGPYTMKITAGSESIQYINVMIGEVWICSGQSNMEMPLAGWGNILNFQDEIAHANFPAIRLLQVKRNASVSPLDSVTVDAGQWQVCNPETIGTFSATAYFFARNVYQHQHVAIGLIHTSWGGTIAEAWTSGTSLKTMPDFAAAVDRIDSLAAVKSAGAIPYAQQLASWQQNLNAKDSGYDQGKPQWINAGLPSVGWKHMELPVAWEDAGLPGFDGVVWFRKTVSVPASWSGKDLQLRLVGVDDEDITFFNGTVIGRNEGYNKPRLYSIPARLVRPGDNDIVIRVQDNTGSGGLYGDARQLVLKVANEDSLSIAGDWLYKIGIDMKKLPPKPTETSGPNRATVLYNAMIHPLIPYGIRGAIWYQGESNASRAKQYRTLFPLLIADWRKNWKQGDFPFYFVQLANFMKREDNPGPSKWAELREAQLKTLSVPKTGMAVIIDIGEEKDIHPKNKQDVGARLGLIARAQVYGEKIVYSGPLYKSSRQEGNTMRITFASTGGGLQANGGRLTGFAIAGADKKFYRADAKIAGDQVIVSSTAVPNPVAVRYAWANNPDCNLYNKAELPASPFRTDNWPE